MIKTISIKVGEHRGNSRIWLENNTVAECGFPVGGAMFVTYSEGKVTILPTGDGKGRKVSGKGTRPVIDLNSAKLSAVFSAGETVTVNYAPQSITITKN